MYYKLLDYGKKRKCDSIHFLRLYKMGYATSKALHIVKCSLVYYKTRGISPVAEAEREHNTVVSVTVHHNGVCDEAELTRTWRTITYRVRVSSRKQPVR